jgi:hypothetical protein
MGQVMQTDTLISGLVGIAISALGIRSLGGHLDQFSARDCEALFRLCQEWLGQPSPLPRMVENERASSRRILAEMRADGPKALGGLLGLPAKEAEAGGDPVREAVERPQSFSPDEYESLLHELERRFDDTYRRVLTEMRKPPWERSRLVTDVDGPHDDGVASRLTEMLIPSFDRVSDNYAREEATVRLLACHAAIRRFKWEHDRLPASLAELKLGELARDPFTGQPLAYEPRGTSYRLSSIGPLASGDDPKAINGRRPVSIVPGDF